MTKVNISFNAIWVAFNASYNYIQKEEWQKECQPPRRPVENQGIDIEKAWIKWKGPWNLIEVTLTPFTNQSANIQRIDAVNDKTIILSWKCHPSWLYKERKEYVKGISGSILLDLDLIMGGKYIMKIFMLHFFHPIKEIPQVNLNHSDNFLF